MPERSSESPQRTPPSEPHRRGPEGGGLLAVRSARIAAAFALRAPLAARCVTAASSVPLTKRVGFLRQPASIAAASKARQQSGGPR